MRLARLLQRLEAEAEADFMKLVQRQKLEPKRVKIAPTPSKVLQSRERLESLRSRTAEMQTELRLKKELEAEFARSIEARMPLNEAKLSAAGRKARDTETHRLRELFADRYCLEASDNWREEATMAFNAKGRSGR